MRKLAFTGIMALILVFLQGCVSSTQTQNVDPCANDNIKVGVVTDTGGINDKSFNQGTWEGVQDFCSETGIGATAVESKAETDYVSNIKNASEQDGVEIVVAVGETLQKATYEVAKDHEDISYILIDGIPTDAQDKTHELDNVKSYLFNEQEAGYLVGYIAGKLTETNKVGFVGGMEIAPVQRFGWGYVQGLYEANPDVEVDYQYSGTFSDPTKGNQIAEGMYSSGADIIFTAAGGVNDGILNSAKARVNSGESVWVIGVDRDMYEDGLYDGENSVVLTSAVKQVGQAAKQGLESYFNDSFEAGVEILGFKEAGVGIPEENPNIEDASVIADAQEALENATVASTLEETEKIVKDMTISGNL